MARTLKEIIAERKQKNAWRDDYLKWNQRFCRKKDKRTLRYQNKLKTVRAEIEAKRQKLEDLGFDITMKIAQNEPLGKKQVQERTLVARIKWLLEEEVRLRRDYYYYRENVSVLLREVKIFRDFFETYCIETYKKNNQPVSPVSEGNRRYYGILFAELKVLNDFGVLAVLFGTMQQRAANQVKKAMKAEGLKTDFHLDGTSDHEYE